METLKSRVSSYLGIVTKENNASSCFGPVMTAKLLKSMGVIVFPLAITLYNYIYFIIIS